MAICPNLTKLLLDPTNLLSPGSDTHTKGSYSVEIIETNVAILWMDCIESDCRWWDAIHSNCSIPNMNLFTYHIHDSHDHIAAHATATVPADPGAAASPPPPQSKASLLSQEYMTGECTDGNEEVLGKDFGLDSLDNEVPKMLLTILNSPDFPVGLDIWSWQDYLDSLP